MKKSTYWIVAIIATLVGNAMHFVHHLFENSDVWQVLGCIFPVCEFSWEHLKMVFYPLLVIAIALAIYRKDMKAFAGPIASACLGMPAMLALFYSYWPFVGHELLIVDIIIYWVVMFATIWLGLKWSENEKLGKTWVLWLVVALVWIGLFVAFTFYYTPNCFLFVE